MKLLKTIFILTSLISLTSCNTLTPSTSIVSTSINPSESISTSISTTSSSESVSSSISQSTSSSTSSSVEPGWVVLNENNENAIDVKAQTLTMSGKTDFTVLYRVKGYVQYARNTSEGHLEFADATGVLLIYGLTKNKSAINYNGSTYSYAKTYTYSDIGLEAGDEVEIECIYDRYELSSTFYPEIFGYVTKVKANHQASITPKSYTGDDPYSGTYYNSISSSLSGLELQKALNELMDDTHTKWNSYTNLTTAWNKCGIAKNDFYTNTSITSINREHVWPKSKTNGLCDGSGNDVDGDFLYLRPTQSTVNEKRGAGMFGYVFGDGYNEMNVFSGEKFKYGVRSPDGMVEPPISRRGDVARTIAYIYLTYSSTISTTSKYNAELSLMDALGPTSKIECYNLLRKWNEEDPVDSYEITINNYAETYQGNRNPFIDHPSYMDKCFA